MTPPRREAVFLDCGALVEHLPHNADPARLQLRRRALQALRSMQGEGIALVFVGNAPASSLGGSTPSLFARLQRALQQRLRDEAGIEPSGFYVCPHAPRAGARPACLCRKPAPGLPRQAALAHRFDLGASWMVGDTLDDVEAGRRAGCRTVLLDAGSETQQWRHSPLRTPDQRCSDLLDAARIIATERRRDSVLKDAA